MRLALVTLDRFKAFERASFEIRPFTVVIGPNNAGKSTLLQALAVLAQSVGAGTIVSFGQQVDLGQDPEDLTRSSGRVDLSKEGWRVGLTWEDTTGVAGEVDQIPVTTRFEASLVKGAAQAAQNLRTLAEVSAALPTGLTVTLTVGSPEPVQPTISVSGVSNAFSASLQTRVAGPFQFDLGINASTPELQRVEIADPAAVADFAASLAAPRLSPLADALRLFRYVGPDRTVDRSRFDIGSAPAQYPRTAQDVVNTLIYNGDVLQRVSERCLAMFGYGVNLQFVPQSQVELVATRPQGRPINIANLGSGMIQLVWIVLQMELSRQQAEGLESPYPPVVGIEEPELHLHPRLQPEVARILAEYVRAGCQVICTSQSEHFLMAVLQMVLDGDLHQDDLSIYYVENGQPEHLEVDEQGRLSHGLRGFFEANEEELLRRMEALIDRG